MPSVPIERILDKYKGDYKKAYQHIQWLKNNKCSSHRCPLIIHYNCYLKENHITEKIGFFDIESTGLKADFGFMMSYCIKENGGNIISRCVTSTDIHTEVYDKPLVLQLCKDLMKFDRIVTFYGGRFDFPFVRSRAEIQGIVDFPKFGDILHTDCWDMLRQRFKLRRSSLQVACNAFGIKAKGSPMYPKQWMAAYQGKQWALDYVLKHNKEDVISTEKLYHRINKYSRKTFTSI